MEKLPEYTPFNPDGSLKVGWEVVDTSKRVPHTIILRGEVAVGSPKVTTYKPRAITLN